MGQHKVRRRLNFQSPSIFQFYGLLCVYVYHTEKKKTLKSMPWWIIEDTHNARQTLGVCNCGLLSDNLCVCDIAERPESERNAHTAILDYNDQQAVNWSSSKKASTSSVCLPHQMPHRRVRKVFGRAKTFFQINRTILFPKQSVDAKQNATPPEMQYVNSSYRQLKPQSIMNEIGV